MGGFRDLLKLIGLYVIILVALLLSAKAQAFEYEFQLLPPGTIKTCQGTMYRCYNLTEYKQLILRDSQLSVLTSENDLLKEEITEFNLLAGQYKRIINSQKEMLSLKEEDRKRLLEKWKATDKELQQCEASIWPWVATGVAIIVASVAVGYGIAE